MSDGCELYLISHGEEKLKWFHRVLGPVVQFMTRGVR